MKSYQQPRVGVRIVVGEVANVLLVGELDGEGGRHKGVGVVLAVVILRLGALGMWLRFGESVLVIQNVRARPGPVGPLLLDGFLLGKQKRLHACRQEKLFNQDVQLSTDNGWLYHGQSE